MDSKAILPQYTTKSGEDTPHNQRKLKLLRNALLVMLVVLGTVAIVGICGVVLTALMAPKPASTDTEHAVEEGEEQMVQDDQVAAISRRQGPVANNLYKSCASELDNETTPAAFISGRRVKWSEKKTFKLPRSLPYKAYKTYWNCDSVNSYVRGGMSFNQDDQSLYFPTCGFYYISSQVLFQYSVRDNQPNQNTSVKHGIEIRPNCSPYDYPRYLYSYSSLEQKEHIRTSTYIGDILKICAGGSMRVVIPSRDNLCCAQGESLMTHYSAYLMEEIDCS